VNHQLLLCAALGLVACSGSSPDPASPANQGDADSDKKTPSEPLTPDQIEALFAREAEDLTSTTLKDPGGAWSAKVEAKGAPKVDTSGAVVGVEIPIGTAAAITCRLFPKDIDAGGTIAQALRAAAERVELQRVVPWSIQVVNEAPAVFVDTTYLAATPRGRAIGQFKLALHTLTDIPVVCHHDETGYKKTFERVVHGFFETLRATKQAPKADYVDVHIGSLGDIPIGYETTVRRTLNGAKTLVTAGLLMLPVARGELRLDDDIEVAVLDDKNRLASGKWVEASGGTLGTTMTLERVQGGHYRYEGIVKGNKVSGELRTKDPAGLPSRISTAQKLAPAAKSQGAFSLVEQSYRPALDATKLTDTKYSRQAGEALGTLHMTNGDVEIVGTIDDKGQFVTGELSLGDSKLLLKRAYQRGTL
jgi:hypothetical protein